MIEKSNNLWRVLENSLGTDDKQVMTRGNLFQLANGYMGYRGTLDEYRSRELVGITLAGIFDQNGDAWREPVNAPNGGFTRLCVNGLEVHALKSEVLSHSVQLDLKTALFTRKTSFRVDSKTLDVCSERFLSICHPHLLCIRYSVKADADCDLEIETGVDYNIWDLNGPHLSNLQHQHISGTIVVSGKTIEKGKQVVVAENTKHSLGEENAVVEEDLILRRLHIKAKRGETYTITKYVSHYKEGDLVETPLELSAANTVAGAAELGFDMCYREHSVQWKQRWNVSDVSIGGDSEAQLALRYSIFQLLMVAPVSGSHNSIPARALSGQVYKGAIFWDTEMFMFPFFVHTQPSVAAELLQYRIDTLEGAKRKAQTEGTGFRGAFYAWESQDTGDDACTYFNVGDPFTKRNLRTHFRDKQVHISGDIAIAMWEYFRLTGDDSLLLNGGAEVIMECARFYLSYAYYKMDKHRFEILDVIGPDEYHERVNNNAFTNKVVQKTLTLALEAINYLEQRHPKALKALDEKIGVLREVAFFEEMLEALYMPAPDAETKLIEQFDGYYQLEEISLENLYQRKLHPNEYLGAGQGIAVPTQIIKQADVVMMLNAFKSEFSSEVKKANWEYYHPRTEHGSSLSACAYAMVAAEIGKTDEAYKYFLKTAKVDLESNYKLYAGTTFIGGSHPAANGGAWMTAIFGFAGLQVVDNELRLSPSLVSHWESLKFYFCYQGSSFEIELTHREACIRANTENADSVTFSIAGKLVILAPGKSETITY
jgi:kojibiose phosphorylase